jgi:hypothetical protein
MANRCWMPKENVKSDTVAPAFGYCTTSEMRILTQFSKIHLQIRHFHVLKSFRPSSSGMLTQHCLVVNRHFVSANRSHLQGSSRILGAVDVRSGVGGDWLVYVSSTTTRHPHCLLYHVAATRFRHFFWTD